MAYVRTVWEEDTTPLSADNMNNIEEGISDVLAALGNVYTKDETYSKNEAYSKDEVYTKTQVDDKISGKITVSNTEPTPSQGQNGDIWFVVV